MVTSGSEFLKKSFVSDLLSFKYRYSIFLLLTFLGGEAGAAIKIRLRLHTKNPVSTGSATLVEITPTHKGIT